MSHAIETITERVRDVEQRRELRQAQAASHAAQGSMYLALSAEKDAAEARGQVHGLMFALGALRLAESEAAEREHQCST